MTYLTEDEMKMDRTSVNLQITIAIGGCKTKGDVCELLDEIRRHERKLILEGD